MPKYEVIVTYQIKKEADPRTFSQTRLAKTPEEARNETLDALRFNQDNIEEILDVWAEEL